MSNGSKSFLLSISIIIVATFSCASQNIYTIAGNGVGGFSGDGGPATAAEVYYPEGIATDISGNVYIADYINSDLEGRRFRNYNYYCRYSQWRLFWRRRAGYKRRTIFSNGSYYRRLR